MNTRKEILKKYIEEKINPRVQGDGGNVSLISLDGKNIILKVQGECTRCPLTSSCFKDWLVQEIKKDFNFDVDVVINIEKPYFWNK